MEEPSTTGGEGAGVPRWVKVVLAVGATVLVLVVLAVLFGIGGEHGPGRHQGLSSPVAPALVDAAPAGAVA